MPGEAAQRGAELGVEAMTGRVVVNARTTYLALLTVAPNDATTMATMTEVTTAGYARQPVTWSAPSGDPPASTNSAQVTFGPFTADPPNIPYCALVSTSTGTAGEFIFYWTLDNARDPATNDSVQFAAAQLSLAVE